MRIQAVRFFDSVLVATFEETFIGKTKCDERGWEIHIETSPIEHVAIVEAGVTLQCAPISNVRNWTPMPGEPAVDVVVPVEPAKPPAGRKYPQQPKA